MPRQYVTLVPRDNNNETTASYTDSLHGIYDPSKQERITGTARRRDSFRLSRSQAAAWQRILNTMLIRLGYDIQFDISGEVPILTLLNVHPTRKKDLREPDKLDTDPV